MIRPWLSPGKESVWGMRCSHRGSRRGSEGEMTAAEKGEMTGEVRKEEWIRNGREASDQIGGWSNVSTLYDTVCARARNRFCEKNNRKKGIGVREGNVPQTETGHIAKKGIAPGPTGLVVAMRETRSVRALARSRRSRFGS